MNIPFYKQMTVKTQGVMLMVLSTFSFAFMSVFVKELDNVSLVDKVFVRNLVILFVVFFLMKRSKVSLWGKKENRLALLARSITGFLGVVFYFAAVPKIDIATVAMLNNTSPFFITLFAILFLKEELKKHHIPMLILAFIGMVIILRPDGDTFFIGGGLLLALLSGIMAGISYTFVRFLGGVEHPFTTIFYFSLFSVLVSFPYLLVHFQMPSLRTLLYLGLMGLSAAIGQYCVTFAYKKVAASDISIYIYMHIIFTLVLGYIFFNELPSLYALIGGGLIILSGYLSFRFTMKKDLESVVV